MQQMDSLTNCFETETCLNAPNSPEVMSVTNPDNWIPWKYIPPNIEMEEITESFLGPRVLTFTSN